MNNSYFFSVKNTSLSLQSIGFLLLFFVFGLFSNVVSAVTKTSTGTGNWNTPATWSPSGVPATGDDVIIISNHTVTVNGIFTCATLAIAPTDNNISKLVYSASTSQLTVNGFVTLGNSGATNRRGSLDMTNGGILNCQGFVVANTGTNLFTPGTGTVVMTATNTIPNTIFTTFNNLAINSGTTTFGATKTITNNFSIAAGAIANLGTFTHTTGAVILGGVAQVPESWGSTSSLADNKNNTYFASTTGVVNNSCTAPTINTQPTALTICENSGGSFNVTTSASSPTYQWQYSTNNTDWTNIDATLAPYLSGFTTATLSLINTPLSYSGNYVRCIVRSSAGCRINSNSVLLTVSPTLSAPSIGTITQPTCSTATASVVLNGLPTGSWVLTRTPGSVTTTGNGTSTTISGLAAGSTYTYSVNGLSNGLKGEYYNNMNLTGSPVLTRTDATVNFNWGSGSPDTLIPNDGYSARWTGLVQPQYGETYTFSTYSDDGIRLWINGVQIINNWTNHAPTTNTANITLLAGVKYNIVLEYYENSGGALAQLSWSSPSQTLQIIPTTRLFPIGSCASPSSGNIVIDAQPGTPTAPTVGTITQPSCSTATGSVVLNGLPSGPWVLTRTPGSVTTTGTGASTTISALTADTYTYSVNGLTNGLKGEYYTNMNLTGSPVLTRTDATVGFNWGGGSPDALIPNDGFSVRWSGHVQPLYSQTYTFSTSSDDGIRLWVNGVQIINNWTNHGVTIDTGNITLTAGVKYSIVLEFFENGGDAIAQLSWSSPSQASQIIPQSQLYSADICGVSPFSTNIVINAQPATPLAPTGTSAQSFCSSSNPTVASLTATGTTIQWYAASSGGSALPSTTTLVNGTHYFATQTNASGCESASRFDVTATVNTAPSVPATATPYSASCSGFTAQWGFAANTTVYYLDVATDTGFTSIVSGYNDLNVGNVLNYALTGLNPATTYYYRVRAAGCSTSASSSTMNITTSSVTVPGTASPYSATCTGFTAQWGFASNATAYNLDVATDAGFTSIVPAYNNLNVGYVLNYALTGLNPSTTYYYRVRASGCGTSANSTTMNFTTSLAPTVAPVASAASSSACNAITVNWSTVANATGYYLDIATDSGFASFVSGYNNYDIGYSATSFYAGGLPAGTLYYRLRGYNSCGVTASSNTISFSAAPSTPTVGTITHQSCTTAGSVVLSGLPTSGTIYQTGTVVTNFPITSTTMTVSGLAGGTYNFSASEGGCTSSATGNVIINAVATNIWDGSFWSNGTPSASQLLTFNGNYPPTTDPNVDITGCSCTVNTGRNVTITTGRNLIITNVVTVAGTGTLTFENNASLVQINDVTNTGNIIYKRQTATVRYSDYTYWSSPVAGQTLNISPSYASGMYYSYNDFGTPEDWKAETAATFMQLGKGYIIRAAQSASPPPPGFYDATFIGVPHNGTKNVAIGSTGRSVLLGNPYPSALDAETFLDNNTAVLEGTIYFWTHVTAIQAAANITDGTAGTGVYAYTSNDYAAYNSVGGVTVGSGLPSLSASLTPSGKIAAGQSFFATSKATGSSVVFNNNMRVTANNTQFFKTKNDTKNKTAATEKNRIWLDITNNKGVFKQTLIGYITDATNNYDDRFDGVTFDGNEFVDFYSINDDKNLAIQGRAIPFNTNDEVPLGFKTTIHGAFTININKADGLLANQVVFLEDKLTNTISNLKTGNYTFNTNAGTFNDRFVLKFTNKTLGTGEFEANKKQVVVSVKNKQIKINSFAETIAKVTIYDLSGKLIYQKLNVNANEVVLLDFATNKQVLIVKTTLENGTIVNNKIIY